MHNNQLKDSSIKAVFGTTEWAESNANFIDGCKHNCKYCYSKEMAIRFRRRTAANWEFESVRLKDLNKKINKKNGRVMFPSAHDIHPEHLEESIQFLANILKSGNEVLIVTKPHKECIVRICKEFKQYSQQILFRFTIGSTDSNVLKFWEPNAPSFEERLEALMHAYIMGFETSVSCEPILDSNVEQTIEQTIPYTTNSIWIGKANFLLKRLKTNGYNTDKETMQQAYKLIQWQDNSQNLKSLYNKYKNNPTIKWKESIKKVLSINIPTTKGLDV